jgi:hypothetical protein
MTTITTIKSIETRLLQEVRRRAAEAGATQAMETEAGSPWWNAVAASSRFSDSDDLVTLHTVLGQDLGTVLQKAIDGYVADRTAV